MCFFRPVTPGNTNENGIYATLPKSLKAELLVGSTIEDPDVVAKRMEIANSKSVSELSQVRSFSDFPFPENIERLMSRSATNHAEPAEQRLVPSWLCWTGLRVGQGRTDIAARLEAIEDRLAQLESKIKHLESSHDEKAVRFYDGD